VRDLADINLWVSFLPTALGGGGVICDMEGTILGRLNEDYEVDIRDLGRHRDYGRMVPPKLSGPVKDLRELPNVNPPILQALQNRTRPTGPIEAVLLTWHSILGHPSKEAMKNIAQHGLIKGVDIRPEDVEKRFVDCAACIRGKIRRAPIPREGDSD
jgi:hypothetical protein